MEDGSNQGVEALLLTPLQFVSEMPRAIPFLGPIRSTSSTNQRSNSVQAVKRAASTAACY